MNNLHFPPSAGHPALLPQALETVDIAQRSFFAQDIEDLVMRACRARGIGFDLFATRFNVPRPMLLEILRGSQPVTTQTRRILEDFVLRALGQGGTAATASPAAPSPAAQSPVAPSPAAQSPVAQSSMATRGRPL